MAKQRGSGVVAAALKVSESQGQFQDRVGQFMTGYDKAMETKNKMEAKNQELQAKTNAYVDQFDGDVDLAGFSDEDKAVVKDQVIANRNEFIEGANGAAKIKDKTSPEYQMYMDKMNDAMSKMEKLRGNLEGIANLKVEYANGFDQGIYSNSQKNSENLLRANAILEGSISSIGDDGSLNFKGYTIPNMTGAGDDFTVEDFSYNTKSFKKPFAVANNEAQAILGLAEAQETLKGEATENQVKIIKSKLNSALSNPDVLYSILSNSELQLIPLNSIDPNDPNAKQLAIDMLSQGILDARGTGLTEEKPSTPQGRGTTATNVIKPKLVDTVEAMQLLENEADSSVPGPIQLSEFELGPTSDPGSLKVTWDAKRKEWTYLNAAFGEARSFKTLKEVMISHPSLFYK
jgi:hypothetical protein